MINKIIIFILLCGSICQAQEITTIKGTVKNFSEGQLSLTIYPNWEENPQEFFVPVDSAGRFEFETILTAYNYIDINIGKIGYLFWMVKGGDNIYLLMDYNEPMKSFFASGMGAAKFGFMHDFYEKYEFGRDADLEVKNQYPLALKSYVSFVDSLAKDKQNYLEADRKNLIDEFFLLKKADIIGKRNRQLVEYAEKNRVAPAEIKKYLEFYSVSPERQALSFEFNDFFDEWIDLNKQAQDFEPLSLSDELNFIRLLFVNGQMERPITELKMHQHILRFVENHAYLPEMQKGVDEYFEFVRNDKYKLMVKDAIERKKRLYNGFPLPLVSFKKGDNKELKNKELEKRHTLFYIYEKDCIICEDDFNYFEIISSNFDKKDKFQLYTIPLKGGDEFTFDPISTYDLYAKNDEQLKLTFGYQNAPGIYFIDQNGLVFGDFPEPSLDEGRSLIKAIRDHMPPKE